MRPVAGGRRVVAMANLRGDRRRRKLGAGRAAYRQLRGTKLGYGRIVDLIATTTAPGEFVVTDLWWLDQVAAATAGRAALSSYRCRRTSAGAGGDAPAQ